MTRAVRRIVLVAIALVAVGCEFSPTAPFRGFDDQGSRVIGRFESSGAATVNMETNGSAATASVEGIVVSVLERPSITATVDQNGTFTLVGVPAGSFTLVFQRDGTRIGEIRFDNVRQNQGIKISVMLTVSIEVVLIKEQRDQVSFSGECPRGAGFWCQNRGGKNPNLTASEFEEFAEKAADMLSNIPELDTADEIAAAVCNTANQFRRHLATLALNLAANTVKLGTSLQGEQTYATVGDAFNAAVNHLAGAGTLSGSQQEALKDVMERINNAQNVEGCDQLPEDDSDSDDDDSQTPAPSPPASGSLTICHIPPGNFDKRHTLTIDASAWPAHQRHCAQGTCDFVGSCN